MPTFTEYISGFAEGIADEFKLAYAKLGDLTALDTASKGSLVAAINEINTKASAVVINDGSSGLSTAYSSSKVDQRIADANAQVKADIIGGASPAYDTLLELVNRFNLDESGIASLTQALGFRLRIDADGGYTTDQKTQARANIATYGIAEIGDITTDFVAIFNNALNSG